MSRLTGNSLVAPPSGTPNLITISCWITASRVTGSRKMKIESFWITLLEGTRIDENEN